MSLEVALFDSSVEFDSLAYELSKRLDSSTAILSFGLPLSNLWHIWKQTRWPPFKNMFSLITASLRRFKALNSRKLSRTSPADKWKTTFSRQFNMHNKQWFEPADSCVLHSGNVDQDD